MSKKTIRVQVFFSTSDKPVFERIVHTDSAILFPFDGIVESMTALFGHSVVTKFEVSV